MAATECIVQRTAGYTVLNNYLLRDKSIGIKAKGLLTVMLSLPEDWDYTIAGLCVILGEGKQIIRSAVQELEKAGYITRQQLTGEGGKFGKNQYIIREVPVSVQEPLSENRTTDENGEPLSGFTPAEKPSSRNCTQIIKDQSITDESNTPSDAAAQGASNQGRRKKQDKPKDELDAGQMRNLLIAKTDELGNQFQLDPSQKNGLFLIAKAWYSPRTLKGKNATPPLHTEGSVTKLYGDIRRLAERLGFPTAVEIFQDALNSGHTKINDPRARIGWAPSRGRGMETPVPAPDYDGGGVYKCL